MIRRRRLRLTPGTVRTLPDPHDPSLPQVAPSQPDPAVPLPPPAPTPAAPAAPPADPEPPAEPPAKKPSHDARTRDAAPPPSTPRRDAGPTTLPSESAPRRDAGPTTPPSEPAQLELTRTAATTPTDDDLPRPREDRVGRPIRGVWMINDDDDRLLRRGTRDDLWSLQRSQQRPRPTPAI